MKGLGTLIRLRKQALDDSRKVLTELERQDDALTARLAAFEAELVAEAERVRGDADASYGYGSYLAGTRLRRADIERRRAELAGHIDAARDRVAEAYRDLKRFEHAQAMAEETARKDAGRREQAALDEVALASFRRSRQG